MTPLPSPNPNPNNPRRSPPIICTHCPPLCCPPVQGSFQLYPAAPLPLSQNEIRVMSLCNHENVVKYYCSFVHDGHYLWLVMPLMHGGSIQNIMRSYGSLEESVIKVVLFSILKGIDYFHTNDHIHRCWPLVSVDPIFDHPSAVLTETSRRAIFLSITRAQCDWRTLVFLRP